MEPEIRYVRTADGVNIAYYEMGEGVPYVYMNMPFSHLTAERRLYGPLFAGIAANARLVRFDPRGFGLSDRNPGEVSLHTYTLDLEAVFDRLELPPAVLNAAVVAGAVGVNFAALHPARLTHLVLVEAAARWPENVAREIQSAFATGGDWRFVSETLMRFIQGWDRPDESADAAAFLRESLTLEGAKQFVNALMDVDLTEVLSKVRTSTLVVNSKDNPWAGVDCGRDVAAALQNGRLVVTGQQPSANAVLEQVLAVRAFLGGGSNRAFPPIAPAPPQHVGTTIILFADVVDSTALTEQLGDVAFRDQYRHLDARLRAVIEELGGTPVAGRTLGDGVLASFTSARDAIAAAQALADVSAEYEMPLHLGIHAGDIIREQDNVWGGAVNIAARVSSLSAPNEILVSATVRDLARTSVNVTFEDRGEHALKGIADPQRVFAVASSPTKFG